MDIGFVGAGKVGTAFGQYLSQQGFNVIGYYDLKQDTAALSASLVSGKRYETAWELASHCDILFITTSDDAIETVCEAVSHHYSFQEGQWVGHMSGASTSEVLLSAQRQGAHTFSLHPIQAFADADDALAKLPLTVFSLEGEPDGLDGIRQIMNQCGNQYIELTAKQKPLYHAGACVISNYMVALVDYALQYYERIGIPSEQAQHFLWPLVTGTINNISKMGTVKALTGPIARGDKGTVQKHIDALSTLASNLLPMYEELGQWTVDLALRKGTINKEKGEEILNLLQKE